MMTVHAPSQHTPRISILTGAVLLLSAALYNGYPLTFWDTRAYVEHAGTLLPRPDRLVGYSVWLRVLSFGLTLWPAVIAQCLLVAWLIWLTLRSLRGQASALRYLLLMFGLTLGSALPWIAGQLMADIFTPVLVLALWLLVFEPELSRRTRCALLGTSALCVTVHLTHLPLGIGLLGVAWVLLGLGRHPGPWRVLLAPLLALLVGLAAISGFNYARTGKLTLASGTDTFLFGHLVESGIASRLLDEHCPRRDYLLCRHRGELPLSVDDLLWVDKLNLHPWDRVQEVSRETRRMLRDSLREHPLTHLAVTIDYTLRVLSRFRTGEGLDADARPLIEPQIARYAPYDLSAFRGSSQQNNLLPVQRLRNLHTPLGWLLLGVGLLTLTATWLRGRTELDDRGVRFAAFVYAALVCNAVLSGNLSGVYDRYESRLLWLLALGIASARHPSLGLTQRSALMAPIRRSRRL